MVTISEPETQDLRGIPELRAKHKQFSTRIIVIME
jgi:hypothetical protein